MKKKLLLSSILTPIIPTAALVSCGNGVIVLDAWESTSTSYFLVYSSGTRIVTATTSSHFDWNLQFNFNILPKEFFEREINYIRLSIAKLGQPGKIDDSPVKLDKNDYNIDVLYNGETLKHGSRTTETNCWYLYPGDTEKNYTRLYLNLNDWDDKSTLSLSISFNLLLGNDDVPYLSPALRFDKYDPS